MVRVEIGKDECRGALTTLVARLGNRFEEPDDYRNWSMQDGYAAHAEAAVHHAERWGKIVKAGFLGNQCGLYLKNRARFDAALAVSRAAERIDRAAFGNDDPRVATIVNNIGTLLQDQGDLDGALK